MGWEPRSGSSRKWARHKTEGTLPNVVLRKSGFSFKGLAGLVRSHRRATYAWQRTRARWRGRKKQALALLFGETAWHLSLDAIDQSLGCREIPKPRSAVTRGGQDAAAVRREDRAIDPFASRVALEGGERLAVAVPQPRRTVIGGGQDAAAVGREHRAPDRARVALEGGERLALAVPQPRRLVIGGGQDATAVERKYCAGEPAGVAPEGGERLAVAVPQPRRVVNRPPMLMRAGLLSFRDVVPVMLRAYVGALVCRFRSAELPPAGRRPLASPPPT